jgi:hypothetical protein
MARRPGRSGSGHRMEVITVADPGEGLATEKIDASYTDGVLTLRIPVAEEAKPRRIEVSHTANQGAIEQSA